MDKSEMYRIATDEKGVINLTDAKGNIVPFQCISRITQDVDHSKGGVAEMIVKLLVNTEPIKG